MAVPETSGVIMIKNIPYGFFEDQMKEYFTQFGTVKQVKIARSQKSGGSRGFGFVLFEEASVAKIAAKAMDNYLMFDEILKCHYIPYEKVRADLFKEPKTDKTTRQLHMDNYNKRHDKTQKHWTRNIARKNKKLADLGIDYQFSASVFKIDTKKEEPDVSLDTMLGEAYSLILDSSESDLSFKTPPGAIKKRKTKPWKDQKNGLKIAGKPLNNLPEVKEEDSIPTKRRKTPLKTH